VIKGLVNDPEDEETLLNLRLIVSMNVEMTLAELEMTTLLRAAIAVIVMEMDLTVIAEGEVEDLKGIEGWTVVDEEIIPHPAATMALTMEILQKTVTPQECRQLDLVISVSSCRSLMEQDPGSRGGPFRELCLVQQVD